jgi:hypothetical protein
VLSKQVFLNAINPVVILQKCDEIVAQLLDFNQLGGL